MADVIMDVGLGSVAEKIRDDATKLGVILLKTVEADATLKGRATVAAILAAAGNDECDFTNYVRKDPITGTLTITSHVAKVTIPSPQTWISAGGATDNDIAKFIVYYDEGGSDATRIPLMAFDCIDPTTSLPIATDGNNLVVTINNSGLYQAAAA